MNEGRQSSPNAKRELSMSFYFAVSRGEITIDGTRHKANRPIISFAKSSNMPYTKPSEVSRDANDLSPGPLALLMMARSNAPVIISKNA